MRRSRPTGSSASGSCAGDHSWDSSAMRGGDQSHYDASDLHFTRNANDSSSSGLGSHYTRNVSRSTVYDGQYRGAVDSRYSFSGASSSAYAPACDYAVPMAATSSLASSNSPRMANTPPIDASNADAELRSRPSQKRPSSPSKEYVDAALEPSTQLKEPASKPKLLILDLNGTLVFRSPHRRRDRHDDPYADPTIQRNLRTVHPRPFLSSLRRYLFHSETREWLDIMIWSSAQPHSVADMVEQCFGDEKDKLAAIWARDTLGLSGADYNRKIQTTKDLAKPWAFFTPKQSQISESRLSASDAPSSIQSRTMHSAHTTLLLDDSPLKAQLQPWNHICIKEYVAQMRAADVTASLKLKQLIKEGVEGGDGSDPKLVEDTVDMEAELIVEERPNEGEPVNSGPGKRKRPHKKKLAKENIKMALSVAKGGGQTTSWTEEITYEWWQHFDCTLLAVVGMLDAVKLESNVAAWVRQGGLWGSEMAGAEELVLRSAETLESADIPSAESFSPTGRELSTETDGKGDLKKQRRGSVGNREEVTGDELMRRGHWFDDQSSMAYWVARGVKALGELDIEINADVRVS